MPNPMNRNYPEASEPFRQNKNSLKKAKSSPEVDPLSNFPVEEVTEKGDFGYSSDNSSDKTKN